MRAVDVRNDLDDRGDVARNARTINAETGRKWSAKPRLST